MSTFCVYGVTRTMALRSAKKKVNEYSKEARRLLTTTEWAMAVGMVAAGLFAATPPRKCSGEFSTPEFCQDFIDLGMKTGQLKHPRVMYRKPRDPDPKTGRERFTWTKFEGRAA